MRLYSIIVVCTAVIAAANPPGRRWANHLRKHSWPGIPQGWQLRSHTPAHYRFELRIGLKQPRINDLIATLMETSDPKHERYGQHLSKDEADTYLAPHSEALGAVENWLAYHRILPGNVIRSPAGDWITAVVTVAEAERMLSAKYDTYDHPASQQSVVRTLSYSLPSELYNHIDVVVPTTYFGTTRSMRTTNFLLPGSKPLDLGVDRAIDSVAADVPSRCNTTITPQCLRTLYNTDGYIPRAVNVNKLGVAGYLGEFANRNDLQAFFRRFRPEAAGSNFTIIQVNGGDDDQNDPGVEANLDIQYTTGISFPTPNIYYSTGGSPPFIPDSDTLTNTNEPYLDWLVFFLNQTSIPQVITTSYGENEQSVPEDYARRVCDLFAILGARGTTVLFSSGDYGVGGGNCSTNDSTNRVLFQPAFPASCPFVTAVGGTMHVNPEVAVSFSGGGFSRYFSQPGYQRAAVSTFLTTLGSRNADFFNATGRAYPDIAAQGRAFQVVVGGRVTSVEGTSASSPVAATVFSLLNDFRLANGKPSLGFINPLIYSTAAAGFNDITSGSNPGCGTDGFTAGKGWDPVTGLGTPDFLKLQNLL